MMVLISYDVSTVSAAGKTRLRKVAKNVKIMHNEYRILFLKLI